MRDGGLDGSLILPRELRDQLPPVSNERHPCRCAYGSVGAHKDGDGSAHLSSWMCLLYLRGSGTFTYIPDDPALPTVSAPIQPGLLIKFDNRAGRHKVLGAEVSGEIAARIFVGPLTMAGILGRGGTCDICYDELHCRRGCRCNRTCDCGGVCLSYSKRHWRWLQCEHKEHEEESDLRLRQQHKGKGKGKVIEKSNSDNVDGCAYCGGDLSACTHAGTVPITVNVSHDQNAWRQINLSKINGEVLTNIDLVLHQKGVRWELNPTLKSWTVRDLLQFLRDEMRTRMGPEAARNIYLTPNGLCLSKVGRDLEALPLHQFMAFEPNQCCDPEWHGWHCYVCGTQH